MMGRKESNQTTFRLSMMQVIAIFMKILCSADHTAVQDQTTWASKIVSMIEQRLMMGRKESNQTTFRLSMMQVIAIFMKILCSADHTAVQDQTTWASKIVSMIRKYHNYKLQTNLWHREEEPHNNHETPGKQAKQPALSSLSMLIT